MKQAPFQVRGVLEGFYGVYYTPPERNDLIRFLAEHGYNLYVYGPKNDRQHRTRWWEPYPDFIMDQFEKTVCIAHEAGISFCYSIGAGVSMNYSSADDFAKITCKLKAFYDRGVRSFSILLDDIAKEFRAESDRIRYKSYAEAHADVSNRLYEWLKSLDPACTLSMCPTDYHGRAPFSGYIHELGAALHPDIDIFYTGPQICSDEILTKDAAEFAKAVQRPPLIWDNYPVNDLDMKAEMHIGPIRGREQTLHEAAKGVVVNLMIQAEASKIPLMTFAEYMADPAGYNPELSWEKALRRIGGETNYESLLRFAENSLYSCLGAEDAPVLTQLTNAALEAIHGGQKIAGNPAIEQLDHYISSLDAASYHLKNRMANYALRNNLLPWIELLEHWHWLAKRALLVLEAIEQGVSYEQPLRWMKETLAEIKQHPKRIAGQVLLPLAEYVIDKTSF